jgi:hypothetical protein
MRISKKATMGICLALGTILFTTTAFAEITASNGYEQAKDALKISAENCSSRYDNFTITTSFAIKDGDNLLLQNDTTDKYDNLKYQQETTALQTIGEMKRENYSFREKNEYINYDSSQEIYYKSINPNGNNEDTIFRNPFKEGGLSDIEKIIDALVGNLKDYAVVEQKPDGSKEISGSISEAQIPAVVNALVSYQVKNKFVNSYSSVSPKFPQIKEDIYVKEIKANAIVDKDGVIQNLIGTGIISGKDEQGNIHQLSFELLSKLTDINSTTVNKPDLTGKKVETNTKGEEEDKTILINPELYLGTYKKDIVIQKDNKFQKIGERIVDITQINDKAIAGRYHEEYINGYDEYSKSAVDFNFNVPQQSKVKPYGEFRSQDTKEKNVTGSISIVPDTASIYFTIYNIDNKGSSEFHRVFN